LWIGTSRGGLNRFDRGQETFTRFQNDPDDPRSLGHDLALSLLLDREGELWIGNAAGLDRFDQGTETYTHYRAKDGLPNEVIYCIAEDGQGRFWLSTNDGLSRFDPQSETFRNYDVTDGLQSNEFNGSACHKSDSEEMFFGGINGFNAFFPDQIMDNPTIPRIVLTSLAQDGEEVDLGIAVDSVTEVTFKWPDNSFEFEFAALSYAQPEKNQFAYMLEGFDDDWNEIGTRRYGKYTNLPGGTYTLNLRGSNNDGVWNEAGTAVQVTIVPPFWATWWFRGVVLFVVLGGAFGGYWLRVRNLEARGRDLELLVEQRTAELMQIEEALRQSDMDEAVAAERNRLARNLHDSVSQTVFSMTLTAEAARILFDRDAARAASELDKLQALAKSALAEMRSLVFELRPTAVTEKGLIPALRHHMVTLDRQHGLVVALQVKGEPHLTDREAQQLFRVIQEALNNVVKHARTDRASVALQFEDRRVLARIEDEGQGFAPEAVGAQGQGIGLSTMRERVEMLGGTLTIDSSPGAGTSVTVELAPGSGEGSSDND
jgi:signal transduction histidine kinase